MSWAQLVDATDAERFGGKAASLARALRAGLPAPHGIALAHSFVHAIGESEPVACAELAQLPLAAGGNLAVRSSAVGEDSGSASFAGQHATVLGVAPGEELLAAIRAVWMSGSRDAALAYRARLGRDEPSRMGVVIQPLIDASVAGVLFTCNPVSGARERVIEASWGLGESVVDGRVIPDRYRLSPDGTLIDRVFGDKRSELRARSAGGLADRPVPADRAAARCVDDDQLAALHELALRCDEVWDGDHDVEWAFSQDGALHLLQRRPVTASATLSAE